jgi:hypothetical protein
MKLRLKFSTRQVQQRFRHREIELTGQDLQFLIDQHLHSVDDLRVSVDELLDYLKKRGPFADYIELAARHEDVSNLLNGVAMRAFAQHKNCAEVGQAEVFDDGLEQDVRFELFTRIP